MLTGFHLVKQGGRRYRLRLGKGLLLVIAMMLMPVTALAFGETVDGIRWKFFYYGDVVQIYSGTDGVRAISDGTYGAITVPSTLGGCPVTRIGKYAFCDCSGLTSVTIPDTVTSIGEYAFRNCYGLTSITIPAGTGFADAAFYGCRGLADEDGFVVLKNILCYYCGDATSVTIPSGVTGISGDAFYHCRNLKSVTIPASVTTIGRRAFFGCSELTSMSIPGSVGTVDEYAFANCTGLTSVSMADGLWVIGYGAFYECAGLKSLTIPKSVGSIGEDAFFRCTGLESLTIPEGVSYIGDSAFAGCEGLASVTIPSSVTRVGSYAFSGCNGLTAVTISPGVADIGDYAFRGCSGLTSVTMQEGLLRIGDYAFCDCSGLTAIEIPSGVTRIGVDAFERCAGLKSVTIPSSVASVNDCAFCGCSGLTSVTIAVGVKAIGWSSFNGCESLTSMTIPSSVTSIGDSAFYGCTGLTSVTIPKNVRSIGTRAFFNCSGLEVVYVEKGDIDRVMGLYSWPSTVQIIEINPPIVDGDDDAVVSGNPTTGFVIKPSEGKTSVEVTIPQGVDAAKVTVEVSTKVASVKPNGAKVKIVSGGADITEFLNMPAADGNGIVDLTKATVKEEIVKEAMDPAKGAEIKLNAANPLLTTPNTRVGLFYQLREGVTIEGMTNGDSAIGDGKPWSPEIKVKGGNSAFYSIGVGKGE